MDLAAEALKGALAALGVLKVLEWAADRAGWPKKRAQLAESTKVLKARECAADKAPWAKGPAECVMSRRGCFSMGITAAIGALLGAYSHRREAQRDETRGKFEDLEFKLMQAQGLASSATEIASHGAKFPELDAAYASYLGKYILEIDALVETVRPAMTPDRRQEVNQVWNETVGQVEMLSEMGVTSAESSALALQVQRSMGQIKAIITEERKRYE